MTPGANESETHPLEKLGKNATDFTDSTDLLNNSRSII
jgi:hypothetical protein